MYRRTFSSLSTHHSRFGSRTREDALFFLVLAKSLADMRPPDYLLLFLIPGICQATYLARSAFHNMSASTEAPLAELRRGKATEEFMLPSDSDDQEQGAAKGSKKTAAKAKAKVKQETPVEDGTCFLCEEIGPLTDCLNGFQFDHK